MFQHIYLPSLRPLELDKDSQKNESWQKFFQKNSKIESIIYWKIRSTFWAFYKKAKNVKLYHSDFLTSDIFQNACSKNSKLEILGLTHIFRHSEIEVTATDLQRLRESKNGLLLYLKKDLKDILHSIKFEIKNKKFSGKIL